MTFIIRVFIQVQPFPNWLHAHTTKRCVKYLYKIYENKIVLKGDLMGKGRRF